MSNPKELYDRVFKPLHELVEVTNIKQLILLTQLVAGMIAEKSIKLSKLAQELAEPSQAASRITRIRRWLKNQHIDAWALYQPVLAQALQGWADEEVTVILDGVAVFGDRLQIFRLSLMHGNRAVPIIWQVVAGKALIEVQVLRPMLQQAAAFLTGRVKSVTVVADRGFRDCDWAMLFDAVGWYYDIRIAKNTYVTLKDGTTRQVQDLGARRGRPKFFQAVTVTQDRHWQANLSLTRQDGVVPGSEEDELWAIISNRPACAVRLREYACRTRIEQSFRDDQSGGFDMEHTRLCHPDRVQRLLLPLALATLWCHELGEWVLQQPDSLRRELDPGWSRQLSLFQLGLRWIDRCLVSGLDRLNHFCACLNPIRVSPVFRKPALSGFLEICQ